MSTKTVATQDLVHWLNQTLETGRFKDYCPNGLQVEGKPVVSRIIAGVTACEALLELAIQRGADAVLVHHGWCWKNENPVVQGPKRRRLALALANDLNLLAFHLPLDAHPILGNNAQLGQKLGLKPHLDDNGRPQTCGPDDLVWLGHCPSNRTVSELAHDMAKTLAREPLVIGNPNAKPQCIAWCTGGAQGFAEAAIEAGAQLYITGEASEQNFHLANETGTAFIAAGHHATERYGVQALGQAIKERFGVEVEFIDIDNPI